MTSNPSALLGPPEARHPPLRSLPHEAPRPADPFMDLMDAGFNAIPPPKGLTENLSATYLSSGNPPLDFFFHVVPSTPPATVTSLLTAAWEYDALTALKLVCHLRGVRGTGKSDKEGFYSCALQLHKHHPKTLALNVGSFAEFGYMKDLLEILYRLIHSPDTRQIAKQERMKSKCQGNRRWRYRTAPIKKKGEAKKEVKGTREERITAEIAKQERMKSKCQGDRRWRYRTAAIKKKGEAKKEVKGTREERITAEIARVKITKDKASELRHQKRAELALRAVERHTRDPDYRFLHDRITEFFAGLLASDLEQLKAGHLKKIGLAAKWCPSLNSSFDRSTLICESIARHMFPRDSNSEYKEIEEQHYAYRVRERLRKEVLVPLRKVLELPEIYMSARQWDALPYNRVASVAMKNYKKIFKKHDKERFTQYLEKVKEGTAKIAAGALLPHEILAPAHRGDHDDKVAELQWQRMVSDLLKKGKLKNCIAVCDVSGSMIGTPMEVCIALGLLISELSEEPWKGRVITFSARPELHKVLGETLVEKVYFVKEMEWNMNTDFQKVFDQILSVAVEGRLAEDKMIKRVFVFSDMEFDQASTNTWETDYEVICRKFQEKGYGSVVPEIVFWNLRDSRSTPVIANQKGVALVSGFSKNLVKMFLDGDGTINPVDIMEAAIAGEEYKKLVVFD